jgi:hypothetical protein
MIRSRSLLCAALALAGCGERNVNVQSADSALYGLGSLGSAWSGGNVPVCFTNTSDQPALQAQIPGMLSSSWSRAGNLHFTGFGACHGGNEVQVTFVANSNGVTFSLGQGTVSMNLISNDTPDLTHFKYEVIHEFGHALGFAHEMKRPDNWVGGNALQCPVGTFDGSTDATQFNAAPGGLNLTPNYDPNSIMNYCQPGGGAVLKTVLSPGDMLAVSSSSAYGPSLCTFPNALAVCTARAALSYDTTFTVPAGCLPALGGWVLKQVGVGVVATAPEANTFILGHQAEGAVTSGPAVGTSPQYQMCDSFNNCSAPFTINITNCNTRQDDFYVAYNETLDATEGGSGMVTLELAGPWVDDDAGLSSQGAFVSVSPAMPGATFSFGKAYSNNTACGQIVDCQAYIDLTVATAYSTPVGNYLATVKATDGVTGVTRTTTVNIAVGACTPPPSSCAGFQCGTFTGCGQSIFCGGCATGNDCSLGHCCPSGEEWTGSACAPPPPPDCNCPAGTYCASNGACVRYHSGGCRPGTCM